MALLLGCVHAIASTNAPVDEASAPAESSPQNEREAFEELEKTFYVFPKARENRLQQIEAKAEKLLAASGNDGEIREYFSRSKREILTLAQNYHDAVRKVKFQDKTRQFNIESMCQTYADAYKALAKGDLSTARISMKRAKDKREEMRVAFIK